MRKLKIALVAATVLGGAGLVAPAASAMPVSGLADRHKSAFGRCPKRRLGVRPLSLLVAPKLLGLRSSPLVGPPLGLGLAPLVASARRGD